MGSQLWLLLGPPLVRRFQLRGVLHGKVGLRQRLALQVLADFGGDFLFCVHRMLLWVCISIFLRYCTARNQVFIGKARQVASQKPGFFTGLRIG